MSDLKSAERKKTLIKLGGVGVVLCVVGLLLLRGIDIKARIDWGISLLQVCGPTVFFIAMALFPVAGVPMLAFSIPVGRAFGAQLGMPLVVVLGLIAVTLNLVITYWLARKALRPFILRLIEKLGYTMPRFDKADLTDFVVLMRVAPGVPFFIQNYILGLADAPFGRYLFISCLISWSHTTAFIIFGEALLGGRGKMVIIGISLFTALAAATHLVRHHMAKAKPKA
jgi:uncharacterized membrane protein YdjX (TVP38/TMEM64 family)